jgi:beta-1,2-mannobiose phosphorylase / 1,2-beta-oligomannan phosphorylase
MVHTKRSKDNPILTPNHANSWEEEAVFNGSVAKHDSTYYMVYRAVSVDQLYQGTRLQLSTVGIAEGGDGVHYKKRRPFIIPEHDWEKFGCEDPRVTKMDDTYFIFYTALGNWPPNADGIRVGVAMTKNFEKVEEKHLVTPFNAKAMAMFPDKVNGKITAILAVNTDRPPVKICIAQFDSKEQMWDAAYWNNFYEHLDDHAINIFHRDNDHLEVGAAPVKTEDGWVLIFSYIENYFGGGNRVFRIDAALLDLEDPRKLVGQTVDPLIIPEEQYELYGMVPNIVFPSGVFAEDGQLHIYYSGCDTVVCRASVVLSELVAELKENPTVNPEMRRPELLARFDENPIISPIPDHSWENKYTFNAGAINVGDKIHILYRAMGDDDTSVLGYASTTDGLHIDERLATPVYTPRETFEKKYHPGFSGCEDPRLTRIENTIYMTYTAYDGINPPRIGMASISVDDFLSKKWNWSRPTLISAPGIDNKDSAIVSEKIDNRYMIFHRLPPCIWVDLVSDLNFGDNRWLGGHPLMAPRVNSWDNLKIGLNGPPEKTEDGWLMLYHGVSSRDLKYRVGAALLDLTNPLKVIARLQNPILEPLTWYENQGYREGTVFSNGQAIKDGVLYVYYGGADKYTAVATVPLETILDALKKGK